jgi:protein-tyrosine phosphatase
VLHGLDDGAKTLDDSLAMLALAASAGTTDIVATPHASAQYAFRPDLIDQRIAELQSRVSIRIHTGCDFHLQPDNLEDALAHPRKYTINHRDYLLVEFPELSLFGDTEQIFLRLLDAGLVPIITHPERNTQLQRRVPEIARWVDSGCCVQVTAGSCLGRFGRKAEACVDDLIGRGLVHFVASDAHDCRGRPPRLDEAYARLSRAWGESSIRPMFVENPAAVLTGAPLDQGTRRPMKRRKWYQRFRSGKDLRPPS